MSWCACLFTGWRNGGSHLFVNEGVCSCICARPCSQWCVTTSASVFASASSRCGPAPASLLHLPPSISLLLLLMDCFYFPCMSKAIIDSNAYIIVMESSQGWRGREGKRTDDGTPLRILERGEERRQRGGDWKSKERWIEETGELYIYIYICIHLEHGNIENKPKAGPAETLNMQ